MPADYTDLNAATEELTSNVTSAVGTENSATTLLNGVQALVTAKVVAALEQDNAADQNSINAATAAIRTAFAPLIDASKQLGDAVANNPGTTPPVG